MNWKLQVGHDDDLVGVPGDVTFIDGAHPDGTKGQEALRLTGDGRMLIRGQEETDLKKIVGAFREWLTRALDAPGTPISDVPFDPGSIQQEGAVTFSSRHSACKLMLAADGKVFLNDVFVEEDDKLRQNTRTLLRRLRMR